MDAFHRLSQLSSILKKHGSPVWKSAAAQFERGLQWLKLRRRPTMSESVGIAGGEGQIPA
jgi:hypothetical protein